MKIIALSGVDGSGKSTQRKLLEEYFESLGQKVSYFHATEFSLANRIQREAQREESFIPGEKPGVTESSFLSVIARVLFLFIDSIRFTHYEHCLEKSGVHVLISDRFFQDSLINICYLSNNPLIRAGVKILVNILPVPEYAFYLQLTAEDIENRDRVPEQGKEYLERKIALYNHPPFHWSYQTIDATQSPGSVHQDILSRLADV